MGQYYYGVILNAKTNEPIMADYCGKLTESGKADLASFAYELSKGRKGYMQRVVWAGDYSEQKDDAGNTLYANINAIEEAGKKTETLHDLYATMEQAAGLEDEEYQLASKRNEEKGNAYFLAHIYNEDGTFKQNIRYLCNHDRREYFDLNAYKFHPHWEKVTNPLAVLTSDPTCRIKGGGDYFYQDDWQYYSAWSGCIMSAEPEVPEGYKNIGVQFACKTLIWDPDTICNAITGEKYGYRLPSPSAYDFGRSICHYDEKHCQLACVSRETILQMYADWSKKVDVERVYKAFDAVMRAVKSDPRLEQEHKDMTVEHRQHKNETTGYEWTDHVAIVNDVEVMLEEDDDKGGYKHEYRHRAYLGDIEYHCDTKSRRYFRKLAKERKAVA